MSGQVENREADGQPYFRYDRFPQLGEKAVVDLVNGLNVINDHLRTREMAGGVLSRFCAFVTGNDTVRQQQIDKNLHAGLSATLDWLNDLQKFQAQSDLAIAAVAQRLSLTREAIADLHELREQDKNRLETFERKISEQLTRQSNEISRVDATQSALLRLGDVLTKWDTGRYADYPLLLSGFAATNELYWGDFGMFCRRHPDHPNTRSLLFQAREQLAMRIKRALGGHTEFLDLHTLLDEVAQYNNPVREITGYLSVGADPIVEPLVWSIGAAAANDFVEHQSQTALTLSHHAPVEMIAWRLLTDNQRLCDRLARGEHAP